MTIWASFLRSPTGLYDEPKILRYAILSICPIGADVKQVQIQPPQPRIKPLIQWVSGFLLFKDNFETKKLPRSLLRSSVAWCCPACACDGPLNRFSNTSVN